MGGDIFKTLSKLAQAKEPLIVEVEKTKTRFRSIISLRKDLVVIAKPIFLKLEKGSVVRFQPPGEKDKDIRLEVFQPHFNLTSGSAVFLCKIPSGFTSAQRGGLRFATAQYSSLFLRLGDSAKKYRIVDISETGILVNLNSTQEAKSFPRNRVLTGAQIKVREYNINLDQLTPRAHRGYQIGCEMQVTQGDASLKHLNNLVKTLEQDEARKIRAASKS